jgi:hypothetical protein
VDHRIAVIAAWLTLSLSVIAGAALDARSPAAGQATGTGVIAGTVTSDAGMPIARARVTLSSASFRSTITDNRGAFVFANLAADEYTLSASRTGYLDVVYGQRRPGSGRPGTPIRLASGQRFDRISLQLARGGVITGIVFDDNGEPAVAVPVRAYRWTIRSGEPLLVSASFDQTDDRGIYRIPFLQPGDYIVAASPRGDVELLQQVLEAGKAADGSLARSGGGAQAPAYAPVFHPGTTRASEAAPVRVDINEEHANVNISLQRVTTGRVSGTVISAGGGPHPGAHITLVDSPQWLTSIGTRSVRAGSTGQFVFNDVPPGSHALIGRTDGNAPLWGRVEIATDGRDAGNVQLTLQRGMNVTGTVTSDDASPASVPGGIRLSLAAVGSVSPEAAPTATVQRNGTFQFRSVPPGRYHLMAAPLPAGHWLRSALFGGRDVLDSFLEVKPNEDLAGVVMISPRSIEIAGLLQDSAGQALTDYTIVTFAAEARYWTPRSRRIQATRPSTDGRFVFQGLPAGDYRLVAITDAEPGQWFDPSFLQQLTADSILVSVSDGARKIQDLTVKSR